MKSPWTKFATAAAVIIVVAIVLVTVLEKSPTPAYALEQTIQANQGLRYVHVKNVSPPAAEPQETWLEFDATGELLRMRLEEGQGDSFRIMTWADNTIKWWSPPKNEFVKLHDVDGLRGEIERARVLIDPQYAVQSLYDLHQEGKVEIEIKPSTKPDDPIVLTATHTTLPARDHRVILLVDPDTKLAKQRDAYRLVDGEYKLRRRQLYLEYNKPIDPQMFVLEQPADAEVEDRTKGIGLPQGNLSDSEVAAEVVRQYLQARIAKDYEKASKLYNGIPAEELRERQEKSKIKYVRIVTIGEPIPASKSITRAFLVPFAYEIETPDGKRSIAGPPIESGQYREALVRPVPGHPDRWVIDGGM